MSLRHLFSFVAASALAASVANAQIVPVGPFTGNAQEGWETQPTGLRSCVLERVFSDQADCCNGQMDNLFFISGNWPPANGCQIVPRSGAACAGSVSSFFTVTFDTSAMRVGGYFGTNSGLMDGRIEFYDAQDVLISTHTITASCGWDWNGWEQTGGPPIKKFVVFSNDPTGKRMQTDDLEAEILPGCTDPVVYCTPKSGLVCGTPGMGFSGMSSAGATSGFEIFAGPARQNRTGLVVYGDAGPAGIPFQGGTLCVQPSPLRRTTSVSSGGTNPCNGQFRIDINSFAQGNLGGNPDAFLTMVGTTVNAQWWGRDSVATGSFLSDAIEYIVCP